MGSLGPFPQSRNLPHFLRQIQSFRDSGRLAKNRRQICSSNFLTLMDKLPEEVGLRKGNRMTFAKHLQWSITPLEPVQKVNCVKSELNQFYKKNILNIMSLWLLISTEWFFGSFPVFSWFLQYFRFIFRFLQYVTEFFLDLSGLCVFFLRDVDLLFSRPWVTVKCMRCLKLNGNIWLLVILPILRYENISKRNHSEKMLCLIGNLETRKVKIKK